MHNIQSYEKNFPKFGVVVIVSF